MQPAITLNTILPAITLRTISIETGLRRSYLMYGEKNRCGNGWRMYTIRRAREFTAPIYELSKNGRFEELVDLLNSYGRNSPKTIARAMIKSAKKAHYLVPVAFDKTEAGIGVSTLEWCPIYHKWEMQGMFGKFPKWKMK